MCPKWDRFNLVIVSLILILCISLSFPLEIINDRLIEAAASLLISILINSVFNTLKLFCISPSISNPEPQRGINISVTSLSHIISLRNS